VSADGTGEFGPLDELALGIGGIVLFAAAGVLLVFALRALVALGRWVRSWRWWKATKVHGWWTAFRYRLGARLLLPALNERLRLANEDGALRSWPIDPTDEERRQLTEAQARRTELLLLARFVYFGEERTR
jgi:hypothetical protein